MDIKNVGGTSGGLSEFFIGLVLATVGGYWLTQQVTVTSGTWALWGYNSFGLSLVPLLLGVMILFANGKSLFGHALLYLGAIIIVAGILANLRIYFQPTSLFNTLLMLVFMAAGIGLILKSLRPHAKDDSSAGS